MSRFTVHGLAVALVMSYWCVAAPAWGRPDKAQPAPRRSDWTFPAPGLKSQYSAELDTTVYDLGHGFHAARMTVEGLELVFVSLPDGAERVPDPDLALVVASKTLHLPRRGADAVLGLEDGHEHRFRTINGHVAGVTLAYDRKTAVVRLIGPRADGPVF